MQLDHTVRRSLEWYVKHRIQEVSDDIRQTFPRSSRIWKCQNESDFLYGYYVGRIEEGSLHYLLKSTRATVGGYMDMFEIRGIIEEHKEELKKAIITGQSET